MMSRFFVTTIATTATHTAAAKASPGGESRRGADAARDPFVEARGVERQRQHGQQGRQSGQIEDGAQRETGCDAESPAAERRGQYVERFSHASIRSMRPSFTYHTYPSTSL